MSEKDAKIWRQLHNLYPPTPEESSISIDLYRTAISHDTILLSINDMLQLSDATIFDFYFRLAMFTTPGRSFYRKKSSQWFAKESIHCFNLQEMGGFIALLKVAPLFKGKNIALSNLTLSQTSPPYKAISHAILDESLASSHLLIYGVDYFTQCNLIFEALQRLKIAIGIELRLDIAPDSLAVVHRPAMFKLDKGDLLFDITQTTVLDYLSTSVRNLAKRLNIDFVFYNFSKWTLFSNKQLAFDYLIENSKIRASFAVTTFPAIFDDDLSSKGSKVLNLTLLQDACKPFWHYLGNNLKLFNYIDTICPSSNIQFFCSRIIAQTSFKKMELILSLNEENYSLIIKSDRKHVFIGYATYKPTTELLLDLHQYNPKLAIYSQSSELFFNNHYSFTEDELLSDQFLLIPGMPAESIASYLIS